jgi:serine/threonine protein kinase
MNEYNVLEKVYDIDSQIGEGAHGIVLKAKVIKTGLLVALKKIPLRNPNSIPTTIIREIKSLEQLDHPNIVKLLDVFPSGVGFCLVFELMSYDLQQILKYSIIPLDEPLIKTYMLMILKGVEYCHSCSIMHRY